MFVLTRAFGQANPFVQGTTVRLYGHLEPLANLAVYKLLEQSACNE
jgi:hypothetical protein